jgi:hypothetical protein
MRRNLAVLLHQGQEPAARQEGEVGFGSVLTWTALDADTKLICSWMVGNRDAFAAYEFMKDLQSRLSNRA